MCGYLAGEKPCVSSGLLDSGTGRVQFGELLPIDEPVAEAWALPGIPNPLPLIDGLLAATAKVHGPTFVTCNVADIAVTGLPLLDPFSAV